MITGYPVIMAEIGYLYVLRFKEGDRIKIGRTINVDQRLLAFGGSKSFNLVESYLVTAPLKNIIKLEAQLHRDFEPHNIEHSGLSSGNSEVFHSACVDDVVHEIEHKAQKFPHLGITLSKGISSQLVSKKTTSSTRYTLSHNNSGLTINWAEGLDTQNAISRIVAAIKSQPPLKNGEHEIVAETIFLEQLFNSSIRGSYNDKDKVRHPQGKVISSFRSNGTKDNQAIGKISNDFIEYLIQKGALCEGYKPEYSATSIRIDKKTPKKAIERWQDRINKDTPKDIESLVDSISNPSIIQAAAVLNDAGQCLYITLSSRSAIKYHACVPLTASSNTHETEGTCYTSIEFNTRDNPNLQEFHEAFLRKLAEALGNRLTIQTYNPNVDLFFQSKITGQQWLQKHPKINVAWNHQR